MKRHAAQVLSLVLASALGACGSSDPGAAGRACAVTKPSGANGGHGDSAGLRVILPRSGTIFALPRDVEPPAGDHLVTHDLRRDGSIGIKFPVWTGPQATGRLRFTGRSLDGRGGRVRGEYAREVPGEFHPGRLVFPDAGCWSVAAHAGGERLRFVIEVVKGLATPQAFAPAAVEAIQAPRRRIASGVRATRRRGAPSYGLFPRAGLRERRG